MATAPDPTPEEYILGTGDDELGRLKFQHQLWGDLAKGLWSRAGFSSGQTVLDIGAGPGFASFDLARLLGPAGKVLAVDSSPRFVEILNRAPSPRSARTSRSRSPHKGESNARSSGVHRARNSRGPDPA